MSFTDISTRRARVDLPGRPMAGRVLNPPLTDDGFLRVVLDAQPGRARECPWVTPRGVEPEWGDDVVVYESDTGDLWAQVWTTRVALQHTRGVATATWGGSSDVSGTVTVTHGLGVEPAGVLLTAQGRAGTAFTFAWVDTKGAATFTFRAATPDGVRPAAATAVVYAWEAFA